jgi:HlyD family secretion protein
VRFTVQAYPNEHFTGQVKQVRLQSKTTENVVNYTVVVLVGNSGGKLLPGMTATLDFLTGTATNALLVPNAALRFRPTEEMRAEVFKRFREQREANGGEGPAFAGRAGPEAGGGSIPAGPGGPGQFAGRRNGEGGGGLNGQGNGQGNRRGGQQPTMLWFLDEKGQLSMAPVRAGLTDGQRTVIESPRIKEGMQVIVAVNTPAQATNAPANPFGGPGGFGGPPGGFQGGGNRRF